jgi:hypothetical protein
VMADVIQWLGEMLRQVNPYAGPYKWIHQMKWNIWMNK